MKPTERTSVSADKIQVVRDHPIQVGLEGQAHLDVIKSWAAVVDAWSASADVIRDVAKAVRENQDDNENTRIEIRRNQVRFFVFGGVLFVLNLITTAFIVLVK